MLTGEMISQAAKDLHESMVARRRDLHQHPEPGWTEFRTASIVATTLTKLGYAVKVGADVVKQESMMGVPSAEKLAQEQENTFRTFGIPLIPIS